MALTSLCRHAAAAEPSAAPAAEPADAAAETAASEETVDVQGTRPAPAAIPGAVGVAGSSISRSDLAPAGTTVPDALRREPGVSVTQTGGLGAPATARVRGASAAQTAVYLGTIRLNDEVGGVADVSTIPTSLPQRIDVYRSLTPRFTGAEGMGGTVLITPRTPRQTEASSRLTFGSFTSEKLELSLGGCHEASCVLSGVELNQARNDYPFYDSRGLLLVDDRGQVARLPNADSAQASGWLAGTTKLARTSLLLFLEHTAREQGAPKLALVPSRAARARFQRTTVGLEVGVPMDGVRGEATFTSSVLFAGTALDDPLYEMSLGTPAVETPGKRLEQAGRFTQQLSSWLALEEHVSISYEALERREEVEGRTDIALSASRLGTRLALGAEVTLPERLSANLRASVQCLDTSEAALDFCSQLVPGARAGALWQKGTFSTYANVAQAARPATLSELYGVSLVMRGNEALAPESATTVEAGAREHFPRRGQPRLWLDASAFARFAEDLIVFTRTAQGFLRPENRDTARTLGAELLVGTEPVTGLRLEGDVSVLDPRDTTPSRPTQNDILPFVSRFVANVTVEQRFTIATETLRLLRLALRAHYESSRYADSAGLAIVPEQSATDLELGSGWFLPPSHSTPAQANRPTTARSQKHLLSVELRIANLFDQRRYDIVGFPLPGRAWFMSVGLEL